MSWGVALEKTGSPRRASRRAKARHGSSRFGEEAGSRDDNGFTLFEILLSAALLLVVLLPSAALLQTSDKLISLNKYKVVAANLVSSQLETDRVVADSASWVGTNPPMPCLPSGDPVTVSCTPGTTVWTVEADGQSYSVSQSVGWCAENATTGVWTSIQPGSTDPAVLLTVSVDWRAGSTVSSTETLSTPMSSIAYEPTLAYGSCPS